MKNSVVQKNLKQIIACILFGILMSMRLFSQKALADEAEDTLNWEQLLTVPEDATDEPNPERRMAHNIYANPDLNATGKKFNGFLIDFKADQTATATYWALCNWKMNLDDLKTKYTVNGGGSAYAGLQTTTEGQKAIMSFWQIEYVDESGNVALIKPQRVYPEIGATNEFGNEGSGTNYIGLYPWEEGKWYRMYLNAYDDESGKTFVEQWVCDLSEEKWTLISRFDTGLYHSYFEGSMSQFMENYSGAFSNYTRTFEYKNYNVREYISNEWTAISNIYLSVDTYWDNKKGNAVYGATTDRVYGITNGYGADQFQLGETIGNQYTILAMNDVILPGEEEEQPKEEEEQPKEEQEQSKEEQEKSEGNDVTHDPQQNPLPEVGNQLPNNNQGSISEPQKNYNPKGTTLRALRATKKGLLVKWKKQSKDTTGYQIQYSTDKRFRSKKKYITIAKNKTVAKTITSVKKGKRYYVRIRTYKKVAGVKYYSNWSKKMSLRMDR